MPGRARLHAITLMCLVTAACQSSPAPRCPVLSSDSAAQPVSATPMQVRLAAEQKANRRRSEANSQQVVVADADLEPPAEADVALSHTVDEEISTVTHKQPPAAETSPVVSANSEELELLVEPQVEEPTEEPLVENAPADSNYLIDLPTVLRLAGTDNWGVRLAYERICEAQAQLDAAEVMWLPSLNLGIGYTKHDGQIQATTGEVLDVSRNSLFVGGSAVTANAPTTGGAGGPARLFVDLSLADAIFQPLAARQTVSAQRSAHTKTFNDSQLAASLAYYDLVGAQGLLAVAVENLADAQRLEEMTQAFVAAGKASEAEVMRVQVVAANRQQEFIDSELAIQLASATLAQLIQLDPARLGFGTLLQSVETHVVPIELTPAEAPLDGLIAQGQGARPEVAEVFSRAQSEYERVRLEEWRPWIPNLHLGVSGGGFGGATGGDIENFKGRSDVDALLVWQVENLGFGTAAARREQCSRYRQAVLRSGQVQDLIAAEVKQAWSEVEAARQQIELTQQMLSTAKTVYERNLTRIRGLEGLPIEAIQAIDAVARARRSHLQAVIRFNQAQLKLLRAIGQPLESY